MASVADALRAFAPAYLKRFGSAVPTGHLKVLNAITKCGTGELGGIVYQCDHCGREHWMGRPCGNRHCPSCQHGRTAEWVQSQSDRLLPVPYFCVTFTVPQELRLAVRAQQSDAYRAIFDAAHEALLIVAGKTRCLKNSELGYFGVLHTWGRDPRTYHPHVHFVVPGGGVVLDESGQPTQWKGTSEKFLVHHGTLIREYRKKLRSKLAKTGVTKRVARKDLSAAWKKKSVVDIKPVGDGRSVLKYLAPYVYRVAISDKRIVAIDETHVTITVTPSKSKQTEVRRIAGETFVGAFLQHVLPKGFHKVRRYGWLNPRRKIDLEEVRWLGSAALGLFFLLRFRPVEEAQEPEPMSCCRCGGRMVFARVTFFDCSALVNHCQSYLDSG